LVFDKEGCGLQRIGSEGKVITQTQIEREIPHIQFREKETKEDVYAFTDHVKLPHKKQICYFHLCGGKDRKRNNTLTHT
jgi:hypothetical protein